MWVEFDTGEFPVAVVSNGERSPYTTEIRLDAAEHVVVLKRLDVAPDGESGADGAGSSV